MRFEITPAILRRILILDAATCAVMGVGLLAFSGPVAALTALPIPLLTGAGALLPPIAALIAFVASRAAPWLLRLVVWGNVAWAAASLALVFGLAPMNGFGVAFVLLQAVAVAGFAAAEQAGLARMRMIGEARS
ncbi:hypothetical protein [Pikeienuella piscinae]|uniref:hypothetical protein n=1 Tax=Pikeienuella piscinae TaxID=2748098 RepID=UPI0015D1AFB3|nr:hypothetical protein [Pikeienuella piscinae]